MTKFPWNKALKKVNDFDIMQSYKSWGIQLMKNNINIVHANKNHKEFLIYANKAIDNVNNMKETISQQVKILAI